MPDTEQALNGPCELTYGMVAMPADTNTAGDIFVGWLMSQIDIAGSVIVCAGSEQAYSALDRCPLF